MTEPTTTQTAPTATMTIDELAAFVHETVETAIAEQFPKDDRIRFHRLQSDEITEIVKALITAKLSFDPLLKDTENPAFRTKYSSLASVMRATEEPLGRAGILMIQQPDLDQADGRPTLLTRLIHTSGQWFAVHYPVMMTEARNNVSGPQQLGSGMTYARRYSALAILGIAPEDDDGMAASSQQQTPGGVYRASQPTEEEKTAIQLRYVDYEAQIDMATSARDMAVIQQDMLTNFGTSGFTKEQRAELKVVFDRKAAKLIAEADAAKPQTRTRKAADDAPAEKFTPEPAQGALDDPEPS